MNQALTVESKLEFDACFYFEYSNDVSSFIAQPEGFYYSYQDTQCPYTPDFLICYQGQERYIEIKPTKKAQSEDFIYRFKAKQEKADQLNIPLYLVTEKQIHTQPIFDNLKLLQRYNSPSHLTSVHDAILIAVDKNNSIFINELNELLDISLSVLTQSVIELLLLGKLEVDLLSCDLSNNYLIHSKNTGNNYSLPEFFDEFQLLERKRNITETVPHKVDMISRDLSSYSESIQKEVMRRYDYLNWVKDRLAGGWTQKNLDPLLKQAEEDLNLPAPKWRTLANWWRVYSSSEYDIHSLIPKTERSGNRNLKVDGDSTVFEKAVARYLRPERPSIATVYQYYIDEIFLYNQTLDEKNKIKSLSYKGFYNRVKKLPQYDVMVSRYGKHLADMKFNSISGHFPAKRVLEKVEIDHTPLDLILLDDELNIPLGRPYLTLLIDQFSRSIVGFHLGFQDPSFSSVRKALLNAIRSKDYIAERFPSIKKPWYCEGKMECLVVDNGAEFWSRSLEQSCLELGIHIQYNPVRKPWLKPLVERIFRTINSQLIMTIPGKTFSNIMEREGYDSKKDAIMRFSTFNALLHTWIIDVYHYEADSRSKLIPAIKWQEGIKQIQPLRYSAQDEKKLSIILGLMEKRKHKRGGISIHNLRYDSNELADYRRTNPSDCDVLVKTDPDDISFIYVYLKQQSTYLKVPCIDPVGYTKGLSLLQHQINIRLHRNYISNSLDLEHLVKVRSNINELIEKEIEDIQNRGKQQKTKGMSRLAKHAGLASDRQASIKPKETKIDKAKNEHKKSDHDDDWDDFLSDLEPY
ncbi:TPA: TnsA endonuclease N-terminal domain-containing protein [Photobacterium damselae]